MLKGMSKVETFDYISETDDAKTEEEGATVFVLGTLSADVRTAIQDGFMSFDNGQGGGQALRMNSFKQNLEALRLGLRGFRNFVDPDTGEPYKFSTEVKFCFGKERTVASAETMDAFPNVLIRELGQAILSGNSVSEKERKNSNTQS